jgi:uncharacterized SAM-binding protein YcdF (DUF218 family)
MFTFRALAEAALNPLHWIALLLIAGLLLWKWPRVSRLLCLASLLLLLVFGASPVTMNVLRSVESRYPDIPIEATPNAEAIVVLGGAVRVPTLRHPASGLINSSDRVLHAFRLYHAGKAPLVLCSGGGPKFAEASIMGDLLREWGVPPEALLLEKQSLDTHQNALFSYAILHARGVQRILLVTSASHMTRATAAFQKAGFTVISSPADFHAEWQDDHQMSVWEWLPDTGGYANFQTGMQERIAFLAYRLRGWV